MLLNDVIQPSRPTVSSLVERFRNKDSFVDNSFQRRLVWTEKQKVRLIETILIGFPMPEVYFWQQEADADTGKQLQSIVDGQQRITTMAQFASNEWRLTAKYLDNADTGYGDALWKDLPINLRQRFWDYVVNVRTIPSSVGADEIVAIFRRLNETDKSLNPQELRNAEFNGLFIQTAEKIADLEEFKKLGVFTDHQIRRMSDIQFTSGLLLFRRRGEMDESLKNINETYDLYNDVYEESGEDLEDIRRFLTDCEGKYFSNDRVRSLFSKQVHLYTLFCLDQALQERGVDRAIIVEKLPEFAKHYESKTGEFSVVEKYREGASSRTRSPSSRMQRLSNLMKWVLQ
jgi:hypothetical protein